MINLGHVVKAIKRPLIIIPTTDPHPEHGWRSWVELENPSVIHLGDPQDLAHELVHVLHFSLGWDFDKASEIIGVSMEEAHKAFFGNEDYGEDEEDFADMMAPYFAESLIGKDLIEPDWLERIKVVADYE